MDNLEREIKKIKGTSMIDYKFMTDRKRWEGRGDISYWRSILIILIHKSQFFHVMMCVCVCVCLCDQHQESVMFTFYPSPCSTSLSLI